jgi:hypothetical protein
LTGYVSLRDAGRIEAVHPTTWVYVPRTINLVPGPGDLLWSDLNSDKVTALRVAGAINFRNPYEVADDVLPSYRELEPYHGHKSGTKRMCQSTITTDLACRVSGTGAPG